MNVLITHVKRYAGPGTLPILLREHGHAICHDTSFADAEQALAFMAEHPGTHALAAQTPGGIAAELAAQGLQVDAVIHNDVHPNTPQQIEDTSVEAYRSAFETLFVFPLELTQRLLPAMKKTGRGAFVFVTSARHRQPEPNFSVATSIRAAGTALALALAREVAPHGIQVNAVEPNYLYSETYYPRARFIDDPTGRAEIAAKVPLGRLGLPEEIGELLAFLVSGRTPFLTGQVIGFTGGWP